LYVRWYGQVVTKAKWVDPAGVIPAIDLILIATTHAFDVLARDIAKDVVERVAQTMSAAKDELSIPALALAVHDVVYTTLNDIDVGTAIAKNKLLNPVGDIPATMLSAEITLPNDHVREIAADVAELVAKAIFVGQGGTYHEFYYGELSIPAAIRRGIEEEAAAKKEPAGNCELTIPADEWKLEVTGIPATTCDPVYLALYLRWFDQIITKYNLLNPAGVIPNIDLMLSATIDAIHVLALDIAKDVAERVAQTMSAAKDELSIPALALAVHDVVYTTLNDIVVGTPIANNKLLNPAGSIPATILTAEITLANDHVRVIAADVAQLVAKAIFVGQGGTNLEFYYGELSIPAAIRRGIEEEAAAKEEPEGQAAAVAVCADCGWMFGNIGDAAGMEECKCCGQMGAVKYEFLKPAVKYVCVDATKKDVAEDELVIPAEEHVAEEELLIPVEEDAAPWHKHEYTRVKAKYMMMYDCRASWLVSEERSRCISRMPASELMRRRFVPASI
jgi:hypothetical protein